MFIIRFAFYFALSFAILSIPTGSQRKIFDHITALVSPYASEALKETKQKIQTTAHYSKKLYSNSEPTISTDQVRSKMAAIKKGAQEKMKDLDGYSDDVSDEEERLRNILTEE